MKLTLEYKISGISLQDEWFTGTSMRTGIVDRELKNPSVPSTTAGVAMSVEGPDWRPMAPTAASFWSLEPDFGRIWRPFFFSSLSLSWRLHPSIQASAKGDTSTQGNDNLLSRPRPHRAHRTHLPSTASCACNAQRGEGRPDRALHTLSRMRPARGVCVAAAVAAAIACATVDVAALTKVAR